MDASDWVIFDPKYVHWCWEASLEHQPGFFAHNINALEKGVEKGSDRIDDSLGSYGSVAKGSASHPFRDEAGDLWTFFYCDPYYQHKLAWKQGEQVEFHHLGDIHEGWMPVLDGHNWDNGNLEYRIRPATHILAVDKDGCLAYDPADLTAPSRGYKVLVEGPEDECRKVAIKHYCKQCRKEYSPCYWQECAGFSSRSSRSEYSGSGLPGFRPFKDTDGLSAHVGLLFGASPRETVWFKNKARKLYSSAIAVYDGLVMLADVEGPAWFTMKELFEGWEFADGSPCGVPLSE